MKGGTAISNEINAPRIVSSVDITLDWKRYIRFDWNGKAIGVILEYTEFGGFETFWLDESDEQIDEPSWAPLPADLYCQVIEWERSQEPNNSRSEWFPSADKCGQSPEAEKSLG